MAKSKSAAAKKRHKQRQKEKRQELATPQPESIAEAHVKQALRDKLRAKCRAMAAYRCSGLPERATSIIDQFNEGGNHDEKAQMMSEVSEELKGMRPQQAKKHLKHMASTMNDDQLGHFMTMVRQQMPQYAAEISAHVEKQRQIKAEKEAHKLKVNAKTTYKPRFATSSDNPRLATLSGKPMFGSESNKPQLATQSDNPAFESKSNKSHNPSPTKTRTFAPMHVKVPKLTEVSQVSAGEDLEQKSKDIAEDLRPRRMYRRPPTQSVTKPPVGPQPRPPAERRPPVDPEHFRKLFRPREAAEPPPASYVERSFFINDFRAQDWDMRCKAVLMEAGHDIELVTLMGVQPLPLSDQLPHYADCQELAQRLKPVLQWLQTQAENRQLCPWTWLQHELRQLGILRNRQMTRMREDGLTEEVFHFLGREYPGEKDQVQVPSVPFFACWWRRV